jgi:hypothetical protein
MKIPNRLLLAVLTAACLAPFLGKAFHIDDTLFVWTGRQIAAHPADPYGFEVTWYAFPRPMSEVTQNPPLSAYYIAAMGAIFGWSEVALHAAFLLPALAAILGTYCLARKLTGRPLFAALAVLASPGFLVSSSGVMCDTMMLAGWTLAILAWLEGLERKRPALLAAAGMLIAICALTKYFGIALIPLILVYTLIRQRRMGMWMTYLLLPVVALAAYEYWTKQLYGFGLLAGAAQYASNIDAVSARRLSTGLYAIPAGLSFAGGCTLPALTFIPLVWPRRWILFGVAAAAVAGLLLGMDALPMPAAPYIAHDYRSWLSVQFALFIAGGISALGLAIWDWRSRKDAESVLLLLWVLGTFVFASLLNWSVNARSVLPMIPAVAILLARRLERAARWKLALPLALAGMISLWVTGADARSANSARTAAQFVRDRMSGTAARVSFEGHWGFQYYMEAFGFSPMYFGGSRFANGDLLVIPHNNTNVVREPKLPEWASSQETLTFPISTGVATMNSALGAGFYSDVWGPLPFAFGTTPAEEYTVFRAN